MSFSHSDTGSHGGSHHSSEMSEDQTIVIRQTYERKIKKLEIQLHGFEEQMEHHDEVITGWKSKCIALEDEVHSWKGKCQRLDVRIHEFEEEQSLDAQNDDKREHKIKKLQHHLKDLERKYHALKKEHAECHHIKEDFHHLREEHENQCMKLRDEF